MFKVKLDSFEIQDANFGITINGIGPGVPQVLSFQQIRGLNLGYVGCLIDGAFSVAIGMMPFDSDPKFICN